MFMVNFKIQYTDICIFYSFLNYTNKHIRYFHIQSDNVNHFFSVYNYNYFTEYVKLFKDKKGTKINIGYNYAIAIEFFFHGLVGAIAISNQNITLILASSTQTYMLYE